RRDGQQAHEQCAAHAEHYAVPATTARRLAHGRASSSCPASRSTPASSNGPPVNSTPTGRPSDVQYSGSEIDGRPVTLPNAVNATLAITDGTGAFGVAIEAFSVSPAIGGSAAHVGVTSTSKSRPQRATSRREISSSLPAAAT